MSNGRHDYFRAIETLFIDLRGAPLLLSPSDWQTAKGWHDSKIPLAVVEEAVREVFQAKDERRESDRINSLRYCAHAVERAWSDLREIQGPARRLSGSSREATPNAEGSDPTAARLAVLAEAISPAVPNAAIWRQRVLGVQGDRDSVEVELRRLDEQLLLDASQGLDDEAEVELARSVELALEKVRPRFGVSELAALEGRLRLQHVRRLFQIPRLTLFL